MENKQTTLSNTHLNGNMAGATIVNHSCNRIVPFIGPVNCGKTALIGRLRPELLLQGYSVSVNDNYRKDKYFPEAKAKLEKVWDNPNYSPDSTTSNEFSLIDVKRSGKPIVGLVNSAGEDYFHADSPDRMRFPAYLREAYLNDHIQITYGVLFNEHILHSDKAEQRNYFRKLEALLPKIRVKKDSVLLIYNKADISIPENIPNDELVLKALRVQYNQFDEFYRELEKRRIRKSFLTFSAGEFSNLPNSSKNQWHPSQDFYPRKLWKKIEWSFSKNWF